MDSEKSEVEAPIVPTEGVKGGADGGPQDLRMVVREVMEEFMRSES